MPLPPIPEQSSINTELLRANRLMKKKEFLWEPRHNGLTTVEGSAGTML